MSIKKFYVERKSDADKSELPVEFKAQNSGVATYNSIKNNVGGESDADKSEASLRVEGRGAS